MPLSGMKKNKRIKVTLIAMFLLMGVGVWGYLHSPENINNLGSYMLTVVIPLLGYQISETWRPSVIEDDKIKKNEGE
jgi:hypothetical protein